MEFEPRWPAVVVALAVGGLYTALPESLTLGPNWVLPSVVLALLIPNIVSHHAGRHRLTAIFGFAVNAVLTTSDGHLELYKSTKKYDGRVGREQHGYPPPEQLPL